MELLIWRLIELIDTNLHLSTHPWDQRTYLQHTDSVSHTLECIYTSQSVARPQGDLHLLAYIISQEDSVIMLHTIT